MWHFLFWNSLPFLFTFSLSFPSTGTFFHEEFPEFFSQRQLFPLFNTYFGELSSEVYPKLSEVQTKDYCYVRSLIEERCSILEECPFGPLPTWERMPLDQRQVGLFFLGNPERQNQLWQLFHDRRCSQITFTSLTSYWFFKKSLLSLYTSVVEYI